MPVIPFVPLIASGIGGAFGLASASKAANAAKQQQASATAQAQPLINAETGLAQQSLQQGRQLFNFGMPLLNRTAGYYGNLLSGSKGAVASAIAPDVSALTDISRGAARSIARTAPGPLRDVAQADLARQRASQIGGLALAVRPNAAQQLGALGQTGVSGGMSGARDAASVFSSLLENQLGTQRLGLEQQKFSADQSQQFGKSLGTFLSGIIGSIPKTWGTPNKLPGSIGTGVPALPNATIWNLQ